jgi:dihydrofolate reductase
MGTVIAGWAVLQADLFCGIAGRCGSGPPATGAGMWCGHYVGGMTRIIADISVSLDGFVTGPDPGPDSGLGIGGEALHTWAFSNDPDDRRVLRDATARSGAVVLGRRLFDVVDGPNGWDDETGYGAGESGKPAFVVVTSSPPESVRLVDLDWTFVTTGLSDAITAARERAEAASSDNGEDLDVVIMGGGATVGSALSAGLVDALTLHLAPVMLGAGTPLFTGGATRTLVQRSVTPTSTATHLTYDVV